MPSKVSLISDVSGDITIGGGSFTLNAQQTTIRKRLTRRDFKNLYSILDSANGKHNDDLGHIVESRIQNFSKSLDDHQKVVSSVVRRLQPPNGSVQQDTAHALLSKAQQLVKLLPAAHHELALQFAGAVRPHTSARRFGDNLALVAAPLLSSSVFSTFSAEVQFMVFYFLVAVIFVDLFHPRLIHNRPTSRVNVLDALGKYHDFPWSACENPMAFHAEFLRRFLNQTGFTFVKSKLYEVEYDGCVMKPDDWATVKPFTDLFVNFVLIQQGEQSRVVKCPWCRWENPLPSVSGSEESTAKCSCSECGRDFSAAVGSSVDDGGDQNTLPPGLDKPFSIEIRRFRIRLQRRKQSFPTIPGVTVPFPQYDTTGFATRPVSPVIPGVTVPIYDVPLPPGFVPQTITDARGVSTPMWQPYTLPPISIEPPSPNSPYVPLFGPEGPFLSPNHRPLPLYQPVPLPPSLPHKAQAYKPWNHSLSVDETGYPSEVFISVEPPSPNSSYVPHFEFAPEGPFLSPNHRPLPIPPPLSLPHKAQASKSWNHSLSVDETGPSEVFISVEPPSPNLPYFPLAEAPSSFPSPGPLRPGPLPHSPSYKSWTSLATLPRYSAPPSSREASFGTESDALRGRQRQLSELLELELLSPDAHTIGPSSGSYLYGGTPDGELESSGDPYLDDTDFLEPDWVTSVSRQRDNSSTKQENLSCSLQGRLESPLFAEESMNLLGLWGVPLISQSSLDDG